MLLGSAPLGRLTLGDAPKIRVIIPPPLPPISPPWHPLPPYLPWGPSQIFAESSEKAVLEGADGFQKFSAVAGFEKFVAQVRFQRLFWLPEFVIFRRRDP